MPFLCSSKRLQMVSIIVAVAITLTVLIILFLSNWPTFVRQKLIDAMVFRDDSLGMERFKSTADLKNLRLSITVYNITNAEELLNSKGDVRFKLQEIGPFVYHEYKYKEILENNQDTGLISFKLRRRYTFLPAQSVGDPKTMSITWINAPVLAAIETTRKSGFESTALKLAMANYKETAFLTNTTDNFIFSGVDRPLFEALGKIPFIGAAIRKSMPGGKFAILNSKNDTWSSERDYIFTTAAGFGRNQTYKDLNQYRLINGSTSLPYWSKSGQCNLLRGTDGEFYSPFLNTTDNLEIYSMDICRKMTLKYQRTVIIAGLTAYQYTLDDKNFKSPPSNPENLCYCRDNKMTLCPEDGFIDLSPCVGDNTYASGSHFLWGSPELTSRFDGLRAADPAKDEPVMHIEPTTGLSLAVRVPIQFNVKLSSDTGFSIIEFYKDPVPLMIPLVTVTEMAEPEPDQASLLRTKLMFMDSSFVLLILGGAIIAVIVIVTVIVIICMRCCCSSGAAQSSGQRRRAQATERSPLLAGAPGSPRRRRSRATSRASTRSGPNSRSGTRSRSRSGDRARRNAR